MSTEKNKPEHNYEWLEDEHEFANNTEKDKLAKECTSSVYADTYIPPIRVYDSQLQVTEKYLQSLPDLQNGPSSLICGAAVPIQQVGIHNFKLPLRYRTRSGSFLDLETSITGTVSLESHKKGINMSRIMRSFYEFKDHIFCIEKIKDVLDAYKNKLDVFDARIMLNFSYPIVQKSLRSGNSGYQYYSVTLEGDWLRDNNFKKYIHFDFVYSSACPCSYELSEHASKYRNRAVVSHSQRSVARVSVLFEDMLWIEDLQEICLDALKTETQVIVKREDEQAFAELNGSNLKFVEDDARLLYEKLNNEQRIKDFKVVCSHLESLHSHDAISVIVKGVENGFKPGVTLDVYRSLIR